ncbi:MAG: hypothetical protein L0H41_01840 [Microlunatus sp.]|nr:hypothetical protein [Microlunatus sp.]
MSWWQPVRWRGGRIVTLSLFVVLATGCGATPGPSEPSPVQPSPVQPSPVQPSPVERNPVQPSPSGSVSTTASASPTSVETASPNSSRTSSSASANSGVVRGVTLRQLGFRHGPLDSFSLPQEAVIATSVDQPNVVTIVLARPSPTQVEDYLRATLADEGFTIDARADVGQAMSFAGHGWTGGFTGTGTTSAIVLRPT